MSTIAGHKFIDTPAGRRCAECDASWLHVRTATDDDVGKQGFAHGVMLPGEYREIVDARTVEEKLIWEAVCGVVEGSPW